MVKTCDCTDATVSTDTTEKLLGTISLPNNATVITGIGIGSPSTATMTTMESMTGYFKVEIDSIDVSPGKFPFTGPMLLGTGGTFAPFFSWPVRWGPAANCKVKIYVCMDMDQTADPTYRGFVQYEKNV